MRINPFTPIYEMLNSGSMKPVSQEMPILIDIEITNHCNFNCLFCFTGTKAHKRRQGFMSDAMFNKIIDEIAPYGIPLRFIRWGEPMLHKKFLYYLTLAKERGIMCHFNTNGSLLNKKNIKEILRIGTESVKFSFQGTDEKTYAAMRYGRSFTSLLNTIKLFSEMRCNAASPYMHASTTVTSESDKMINDFKETVSPFCDLVSVGKTNLSHIDVNMIKLSDNAKQLFSNHKKNETIKKKYKTCSEVYSKLSINWDGTVSACCGDYDNYMIVGDLNSSTINEIWSKSETLKKYRALLSNFKHKNLPLCKNCYDTMNLKKDNAAAPCVDSCLAL